MDPEVDVEEAKELYGVRFTSIENVTDMDAIILAVAHEKFKQLTKEDVSRLYGNGTKVLLDIKGLMNRKEYEDAGYSYWRL